jgi:hypothetical protein
VEGWPPQSVRGRRQSLTRTGAGVKYSAANTFVAFAGEPGSAQAEAGPEGSPRPVSAVSAADAPSTRIAAHLGK